MKLSNDLKPINIYNGTFNVDAVLRENMYGVDESEREALYVCNLTDIVNKYVNWCTKMPRVKPFYAVKCNNHEYILKLLANLGTGFDCASAAEIEAVLKLGVTPDRIIYAHPAKPTKHILKAAATNTRLLVFDSIVELNRINDLFPEAQLVLRIRCDARKAITVHGTKFGCDPQVEALRLLDHAKKLGMTVVGISFHVGSGCEDLTAHARAIAASRNIFNYALTLGYRMSILDIGGGFPGHVGSDIVEFADVINSALESFFPEAEFPDVKVISEPGAYFVESACTLGATMYSKAEVLDADENDVVHVKYYINDSINGSFALIPYGYHSFAPRILAHSKKHEIQLATDTLVNCTIWGQTCSGMDKICNNIDLPNVELGDVIVFSNVGHYSLIVLGSNFNGFPTTKVTFYATADTMKLLESAQNLLLQNEF